MTRASPRLAARAIVLHENRLLMVNAYRDHRLELWCAPGGGVEKGQSLPANLAREVHEECGLSVTVGAPCLINEFHDPDTGFHQVDIYFRCALTGGDLNGDWTDPEGIVNRRRWFSRAELWMARFGLRQLAGNARARAATTIRWK
ncbi:MAG: NUDIX hydrolase [Paracoccaceae bacterium]